MRTCRRASVILAVVLVLTSCGGGDGDARPSSTSATSEPTGATESVPYLLLVGPEWESGGAATAETMPGGMPFGGVWTLSYNKRVSPMSTISTSLFLADPDESARQLADEISSGHDSEVTTTDVGGSDAVAIEEHAPGTGALVAVHVLWDIGTHIAWVTVYDQVDLDGAIEIAREVTEVSEAEWEAATGQSLS